MTTLNFDEDQVEGISNEVQSTTYPIGIKRKCEYDDLTESISPSDMLLNMTSNSCPNSEEGDNEAMASGPCPITGISNFVDSLPTFTNNDFHPFVSLPTSTGESDRQLDMLVRQTHENTVLLREVLSELQELKEQMQRKFPFTVKTCGFERELVTRAKELFINNGPWLVHGAVESLKEKITELLGGVGKADTYHINACVSYCKEKFTLWRAEIRKKVLNKKFNHLRIIEFTEKLYTPFKNKEADMKNATKTAMLLRKFAAENGYLTQTSKADFWENFVEYVNTWNNLNSPHKWAKLRQEDEATYKNTLFPV